MTARCPVCSVRVGPCLDEHGAPIGQYLRGLVRLAEFADWSGTRVEILRRSKDGSRVYVSWWGQSKLDDGKLRKAWIDARAVR